MSTRAGSPSARSSVPWNHPGRSRDRVNGPGELTLTSIVLFTLGAYGVAAGAASGQQSVVAVGVFAFTLFVVGTVAPIVSLSRIQVDAWASPDTTVGERHDVHVRLHGNAGRVEV